MERHSVPLNLFADARNRGQARKSAEMMFVALAICPP